MCRIFDWGSVRTNGMFRTTIVIGAVCFSLTVTATTAVSQVDRSNTSFLHQAQSSYWDEDPRYEVPRYEDPRYEDPRYEDPRYYVPHVPRRIYRPRSYRYHGGPPSPPIQRYELRPIAPPLPPAPSNCGEYHYWNGSYCADARHEPPYVGPRW